MLDKIKKWFLQRQFDALTLSIELTKRFLQDPSLLDKDNEEAKELWHKLTEELSLINAIYRGSLSDDDQRKLNVAAGLLDNLWRIYNYSPKERAKIAAKVTEDVDVIAALKDILPIITALADTRPPYARSEKPSIASSRYAEFAIWNPDSFMVLTHIHKCFEDERYSIVGGAAVQLHVANAVDGDVRDNETLKERCRVVHDVDMIFPEGSDKNKILPLLTDLPESLFEDVLYSIEVLRSGAKRPIVEIKGEEDGPNGARAIENKFPLNISYSYKEAIGQTRALYDEIVRRTEIVRCVFSGKSFAFRVVSVDAIIISKANRLADKDLYDIFLLLEFCSDKIDWNFIERSLSHEKFTGLLSRIHSYAE